MNNGPHECNICYECHANLIFLSCLHSMCKTCLSKLQKRVCPFCRRAFPENVPGHKPENNHFEFRYEPDVPVIRIRVRRRRRRIRTTTDTLDTMHGTVIIETPHNEFPNRRKKPRAGKNNFRKGNWTRANHRNGCVRVK
jgi:hypothetical protein